MLMINHMKKTYIQKICVKTMKNMEKKEIELTLIDINKHMSLKKLVLQL